VLEVDEGGEKPMVWREVDDLSQEGPEERAFVIDPTEGVVEFGDGEHGLPLPDGFRHVRARSYRVAPAAQHGSDGSRVPLDLAEDTITTLVASASFVVGVTNPRATSAGAVEEDLATTVRRGPREIRARNRAVTPADFELLALRAGARVRRVHAAPGLHPLYPGRPIPGVVGLFVVAADPRDGQPPVPDEDTLREVASFVAAEAALAGVEVVAAAPLFHRVRLEMAVAARADRDPGVVVARVIEEIDRYFHPLHGGEAGEGWRFGGTIRWVPLARRLLVRLRAEVTAIPRLNLVVDGLRTASCADRTISAHSLLWPEPHEVLVVPPEEP